MLNTTITYCTYVTHARVNLKIVCVGGWVVSNKCPPPIPRTWGSPGFRSRHVSYTAELAEKEFFLKRYCWYV